MPAIVDAEKCDGCRTCQINCRSDAIHVPEKVAVVQPEKCIDCNLCKVNCPHKAIEMRLRSGSRQRSIPRLWNA